MFDGCRDAVTTDVVTNRLPVETTQHIGHMWVKHCREEFCCKLPSVKLDRERVTHESRDANACVNSAAKLLLLC